MSTINAEYERVLKLQTTDPDAYAKLDVSERLTAARYQAERDGIKPGASISFRRDDEIEGLIVAAKTEPGIIGKLDSTKRLEYGRYVTEREAWMKSEAGRREAADAEKARLKAAEEKAAEQNAEIEALRAQLREQGGATD